MIHENTNRQSPTLGRSVHLKETRRVVHLENCHHTSSIAVYRWLEMLDLDRDSNDCTYTSWHHLTSQPITKIVSCQNMAARQHSLHARSQHQIPAYSAHPIRV
jgi:hypothetical protein